MSFNIELLLFICIVSFLTGYVFGKNKLVKEKPIEREPIDVGALTDEAKIALDSALTIIGNRMRVITDKVKVCRNLKELEDLLDEKNFIQEIFEKIKTLRNLL